MNVSTRRQLRVFAKRLKIDKLFWYTYGLLQDSQEHAGPDRVMGVFVDSLGEHIQLIEGHRDSVVPGWRGMVQPPRTSALPSPESASAKVKANRDRLARYGKILDTWSCSIAGRDVLEVGAHDGATAYALAEAGAKSVVATDVAAYYITQSRDGVVREDTLAAKSEELMRLRDAHRAVVRADVANRVEFVEDDICVSVLPSESADLVITFEVLEHILRPEDGFRQMARVLRPGGFAFHEYNPFFSLNGGHSLCTLDFPWGHARLDAADMERYLQERRPGEKAVALSFYRNNLSRMTLAQLRSHVHDSGLTIAGVVPWCSEVHLGLLSSTALAQCRRLYEDVEITDLISPTVWILLRKAD